MFRALVPTKTRRPERTSLLTPTRLLTRPTGFYPHRSQCCCCYKHRECSHLGETQGNIFLHLRSSSEQTAELSNMCVKSEAIQKCRYAESTKYLLTCKYSENPWTYHTLTRYNMWSSRKMTFGFHCGVSVFIPADSFFSRNIFCFKYSYNSCLGLYKLCTYTDYLAQPNVLSTLIFSFLKKRIKNIPTAWCCHCYGLRWQHCVQGDVLWLFPTTQHNATNTIFPHQDGVGNTRPRNFTFWPPLTRTHYSTWLLCSLCGKLPTGKIRAFFPVTAELWISEASPQWFGPLG